MTVTFQAQCDPKSIEQERDFSKEELDDMEAEFNNFCYKIEKYSYTRYQMYINGVIR